MTQAEKNTVGAPYHRPAEAGSKGGRWITIDLNRHLPTWITRATGYAINYEDLNYDYILDATKCSDTIKKEVNIRYSQPVGFCWANFKALMVLSKRGLKVGRVYFKQLNQTTQDRYKVVPVKARVFFPYLNGGD
jgi:hypothetical protein